MGESVDLECTGGKVPRPVPAIDWQPGLDVGVGVMDRQHRHLAALINRLALGLSGATVSPGVYEQFAELIRFAGLHFATEERLMEAHGLRGQDPHRAEHRRLLAEVANLSSDWSAMGVRLATALLRDWLLQHIRTHDAALAATLREHGTER